MSSHRRSSCSFRSVLSFRSRALLVALAASAAACTVATEKSPEATGEQESAMWRTSDPILEGTLSVLHGVSRGAPTETIYILRDASGVTHSLSIPPAVLDAMGSTPGMEGGKVRVRGPLDGNGSMTVNAGVVTQPAVTQAPSTRPLLNLLCQFADGAHPDGHDQPYFDELFGMTYPGIGDYFKKVSNGAIDFSGITTTDSWYQLSQPIAHYKEGTDSQQVQNIVTDCLGLIKNVEELGLNHFSGLNIILSENWRGEAFGGPLDPDGAHPGYPVTILSPLGFTNQVTTAQAIGATLGMNRSSLSAAGTLDSKWDLMSAGGTCATVDPSHGCIAVQPIADTRRALGWLPDDQVTTGSGPNMTFDLSALAAPPVSGTFKLGVYNLPSGGYVTAELRLMSADVYEQNLPGQEIALHVIQNPASGPGSTRAIAVDASPNTPDATGQDVVLHSWGNNLYVDPSGRFGASVDWTWSDTYTVSLFQPGALNVSIQRDPGADGWLNGPQIACGVTCNATYPAGTTVKLTATAGASSVLKSMTGCDSVTGNTCTIWDATRPHSVNAYFASTAPKDTCLSDCLKEFCGEFPKTCHKTCNTQCGH